MLVFILYYSFGYRYDIKNGTTTQTGMILIKTSPKDVAVYKNQQIIKINKSISSLFNNIIKIENLDQGEYNITVQKDNYHSWEKNIKVKKGLATSFDYIVLLKENYSEKNILKKSKSDLNSFWTNNQANKIVYSEKNNLNLFDLKDNSENIIHSFADTTQNNINIENIIWSNDGKKFIIKIKIASISNWYLVNSENKLTSLNNIFHEDEKIRSKSNISLDQSLYYINENNLYKFDYRTLSFEKILDNVHSFLIQNNHIYYFSKNDNKLYSANINDFSKIKTIITMPKDFDNILLAEITKSDEKTFTILSASGNLYFINKKNEVIYLNSFVKKSKFSDDNKKIIYNNKHEIWIYYINQDNSSTLEQKFSNELITRFSGIIDNVYLYKDNEHLIYREGTTVKFLELDNRDRRNVFELMNINRDISYIKDLNSMFYIENNSLIQIDLNEE